MKRPLILPILFTCILLTLTGVAHGQKPNATTDDYKDQIARARAYSDSLRSAQKIPALSIAVGVGGKLVWSEAFGMADTESGQAATTETKFRVGSISKSMTAFALAKLFDEEKLNFDDELGNYLPQFADKKYPVTLRQVAGHQGGIRHYKGFEFLSNKQYNSVEEAMTTFEKDELEFEPGTKFLYSTYGYVALSRVIEKVSGKSYLDYMGSEVFQPLGMTNTVAEDAGEDESNRATFYNKGGKRKAGEVNLSSKWAGGGFLTTPTDLVNMVDYATKIISPQTLFTIIKPQNLKNGEPTGYCMGWRYTETKSDHRILIHHGGTSAGARAFLMLMPNERIVVAVCTNTEADYNLKEVYDIAKFFMK